MLVTINGRPIAEWTISCINPPATIEKDCCYNQPSPNSNLAEKILLPLSITAGILNVTKMAQAAGVINIADSFWPIIQMFQEFALPVGIAMSMWGLIEIMLGNPGGKEKIRMAIIGFIGIYVIPTLFMQIRAAFAGLPR